MDYSDSNGINILQSCILQYIIKYHNRKKTNYGFKIVSTIFYFNVLHITYQWLKLYLHFTSVFMLNRYLVVLQWLRNMFLNVKSQ